MPYEDYRAQLLRDLRQQCELDAVVAGAQTEFAKIARLHRWAYHIPLSDCNHFPWDPLAWVCLERDEDGAIRMNQYEQRRRDHMCLYPNVVLVAACLSMGIPARHLNFHSEGMTGHEIAEVWSNDHGKWMHLDATRDYYWYDPKTLVPLDTQEIHQVLAERLERPNAGIALISFTKTWRWWYKTCPSPSTMETTNILPRKVHSFCSARFATSALCRASTCSADPAPCR